MSLERSITEHRRGTIDARRGTVDPRSSRISSISQHQDSGKRYSQTVNPIDNTTVMLADGDYWLMFRPTSPRRLAWDILMMFLLIYVAIVAPYRIGFGADASGNWKTWETVLDMLFILDLFVNFRTGYFFEEEEVMEQSRVAKHYLKVS